MAPPQVVLQDVKNPLRGLIRMQKSIEIHLPYYEIPQLSPHYPWCTLYTVAPSSQSIRPQLGPAKTLEKSTTTNPSKGFA